MDRLSVERCFGREGLRDFVMGKDILVGMTGRRSGGASDIAMDMQAGQVHGRRDRPDGQQGKDRCG